MTEIEIPANRAHRHGGPQFFQGGAKFAETFELWGGLRPGDRVLDIGCGPGRMAIGIGERFNWANDLIGFDIIKVDVDVCKQAITRIHPNFCFHYVDAWNGHYNPTGTILPDKVVFPADDGTIDFAFATSVFTHMFRREVAHYLGEINRVLAPGGRLLTTWFAITEQPLSPESRFSFKHSRPDGSFVERPDRPEDVVGYRHDDIIQLLQQAGFSDVTFHQGAWSRANPKQPDFQPRHSQDVFVCRK